MKMVMSDRSPTGLRFWYSRVAHLHVQHITQITMLLYQMANSRVQMSRTSVRPTVRTHFSRHSLPYPFSIILCAYLVFRYRPDG